MAKPKTFIQLSIEIYTGDSAVDVYSSAKIFFCGFFSYLHLCIPRVKSSIYWLLIYISLRRQWIYTQNS